MALKHNPPASPHLEPSTECRTILDLQMNALILWDLRGPQGVMQCLAVSTAYGHAFALVLTNEIIFWELRLTAEEIGERAARLEAWLLTRGWSDDSHARTLH